MLIAPLLGVLFFPFVITWRIMTWPIEVLEPYYDDISILATYSLILSVVSLLITAILVLVWVLMLNLSAHCFPRLASAEDEHAGQPPEDRRGPRQGPKRKQQRRQYHHLQQPPPIHPRSTQTGRTNTTRSGGTYPYQPQDEPLASDLTSPTASGRVFNNLSAAEPYSSSLSLSPSSSSLLLAASPDLDSDSDLSPQSYRDRAAAVRLRRRRARRLAAMAQQSQAAAAEGLRRRRTRTALGNRVEVDDTIHEDSLSG
ncbi:hypothetical protein C8A03DRAFT_30589 [Achaetomium macrosporum]|uniref:Uncharacterized protein n=1 Tax=Achaetomium macrosporum TaxID=79813 RepID=A0AAN7HDR3_9PEZI|nr:hypothetical protein C8A03DRAFT_30589 [Achaetomium macrosporum]